MHGSISDQEDKIRAGNEGSVDSVFQTDTCRSQVFSDVDLDRVVDGGKSLNFCIRSDCDIDVPKTTEALFDWHLIGDSLFALFLCLLGLCNVSHVGRDISHWEAEAIAQVFDLKLLMTVGSKVGSRLGWHIAHLDCEHLMVFTHGGERCQ